MAAGPAQRHDPEAPSTARMWNAWLGGTNYGAADMARAAEIEQAVPRIRDMAVNARLFSARAVAWAASEGTGQFIELGCGVPPRHVHEYARSVRRGARVAYVDWDEDVTAELPGLLGYGARPDQPDEEVRREMAADGLAVITADLRCPGRLLARRDLRAVIDLRRPACVLLVGVLHLVPPEKARALIAGYAARLAPGSVIAVTALAVPDDVTRQRLARIHLPHARYETGPEEVASWFAGLDLVMPGIAMARYLRPGWGEVPALPAHEAHVLAGIGRVP